MVTPMKIIRNKDNDKLIRRRSQLRIDLKRAKSLKDEDIDRVKKGKLSYWNQITWWNDD
jgi:hypothetical protein